MKVLHIALSRLLPLGIFIILPLFGQERGSTIRGTVRGIGSAPLAGVRIVADEFGVSRDTDSEGRFSLSVPAEVGKKGSLRLSFSLEGYQTYSIELKTPLASLVKVTLVPLYARSFPPSLPPALVSRLREYRRAEIQKVHSFLASPDKKLLAVEGVAGIGADHLIVTALQDVPVGSRRPVFWWDCQETDSLTLLAEEWARAFKDQNLANVSLRSEQPITPEERRQLDREIIALLLDRLRRSPRTVVFAKFEHWFAPGSQAIEDPSLADFLASVISHAQNGKVVIISEERPILPQNLSEAWVERLLVQGLTSANAADFLYQYVGLQLERNLLMEIGEKLGGHPVAMQLFAGGLTGLSQQEQERQARELVNGKDVVVLKGELDQLLTRVYSRLSPKELQILWLLAVARKPLTIGEMEEIGTGAAPEFTYAEIRRTSEQLVHERFWVERLDDPRTGEDRYSLVEIVQQFLDDRLLEDRARTINLHRRVRGWYSTKFPRETLSKTLSPATLAGYDEFVHHSFSLAEISAVHESQEATLAGAEVALDIFDFHVQRAAYRLLLEQFRRSTHLLTKYSDVRSRQLYAGSMLRLGNLYTWTDRLKEAERCYAEALPLFQVLGDNIGKAHTLKSLGDLLTRTDRLDDAERLYAEASALYSTAEDRLGEANTRRSLGDLYVRSDRLKEAEQLYKQTLPFYQAIANRFEEANILRSLGALNVRTERWSEAEQRYMEALSIYRSIENRLWEATTLRLLGTLCVRMTRWKEAEQRYSEALPIFRAIEFRLGEANTLMSLGDLYVRTDRRKEAEKRYIEALPIHQAIENRLGEGSTLMLLGDLYAQMAQWKEAEPRYLEALRLYRDINSKLGEANTLMSLGTLYVYTDRLQEAEQFYGGALPLYHTIEDQVGEANTLLLLADLYVKTNRLQEAEHLFAEALPRYRVIQDRAGEATAFLGLGDLLATRKEFTQAIQHYEQARIIYEGLEDITGQINAHFELSEVYMQMGQPEESLGEALSALLLAIKIDLPQIESISQRLLVVREALGSERFASNVDAKIRTLARGDQEHLRSFLLKLK